MRMRIPVRLSVALPVLCLVLFSGRPSAQVLSSTLVQGGFTKPIYVCAPPADTTRLFVVEQDGLVKIIKNGSLLPTAFIDLVAIVGSVNNEQGLLGMAFHPNYASNGYFYVSYTDNGGDSVIRRYTVSGDPDVADTASFLDIFGPLDQPQSNHNGGCIQFGPNDGYLYYGLGDGGASNDTGTGHVAGGNAQSPGTYLGKMLRLDVDGTAPYVPATNPFASPVDGILDLIWSFGQRNPWRFSFDRLTGDLYTADVGQNAWEEVDFQPASSAGGENYGWRCMEGAHCTGLTGCTCNAPALTLPIHEYSHAGGRCSITGGYVYRGSNIAGMYGTYIFADYCAGTIWTFKYDGTTLTNLVDRTAQIDPPGALVISNVTSFGEDANGEIYICDQNGGEVYRLTGAGFSGQTFCAGDDIDPVVTTDCPCSNFGFPGNGCGNSFDAGGAYLDVAGTTNPTNTLLFAVSPVPNNALCTFLRSTGTSPAGAVFGDGVSCLNGTLVRFGQQFAGQGGNLPHTAEAATPTVAPGSTRYYQCQYRNPAPAFCPPGTFNVSNGWIVQW